MKQFEAFKSNFYRKEDVASPVVLTIGNVSMGELKTDHGKEEKPVMSFLEDERQLVLNVTNWVTLENAYGPESDGWTGKRVELYCDPNVMMGKERIGGIRVRLPNQSGQTTSFAEKALSWDDALKMSEAAGITKDALIARLKQAGRSAYNAARDADIVRLLVSEAESAQNNTLPDDGIPF